ncbi:MAG: DUF2953 domain-containing protein [Firmicutes bacterium]|nr:DUF2953 domain-containing protein [Bacillota bacterium]MCL5040164.1 DUF2953 domain-containing protein [Bacillota bacterium]
MTTISLSLGLFCGLLVGVLLLSFLVPFNVAIRIKRKEQDEQFSVEIETLKGLVDYRYQVPAIWRAEGWGATWRVEEVLREDGVGKDQELKTVTVEKVNWGKLIRGLRLGKKIGHEYARLIRYLARRTWCRNLTWQSAVGTEDAAATGLLYGFLWALKGSAYALMTQHARIKGRPPRITLSADFLQPRLDTDFACIFVTRLGYIMTAGSVFFWRLLLKGVLTGERASHPRLNEDGHGEHQGNGGR